MGSTFRLTIHVYPVTHLSVKEEEKRSLFCLLVPHKKRIVNVPSKKSDDMHDQQVLRRVPDSQSSLQFLSHSTTGECRVSPSDWETNRPPECLMWESLVRVQSALARSCGD